MNILAWILFGLLVGITADALDADSNRGVLGNILLGVTGALTGGVIASLIFNEGLRGFTISSFLVAVAGSLALLFVGKIIQRRNYY